MINNFEKGLLVILIPFVAIMLIWTIWLVAKSCQKYGKEKTFALLGLDKASLAADREKAIKALKELLKTLKAMGVWIYEFVQSLQKPVSPVLVPDKMLESYFYKIIGDYAYNAMSSEVGCDIMGFPKFVYADFYTKNFVTDEVRIELIAHFSTAFRDWAQSRGWNVELHPVCDVIDNHINIRIYYHDTPEGAVAFANWKHSVITREIGCVYTVLEENEIAPLLKNDAVFIGVDAKKRALGVTYPLYWSKDIPHGVLCGPTGSGKSVLAMSIVRQLLAKHADIIICDFKAGGDWKGILPPERYATYRDCDRLFDAFYQSFEETIGSGIKRDKYLIFDEISAWMISKKGADKTIVEKKLTELVLMGRAYGFHLLLIAQQPNSTIIPTNAREGSNIDDNGDYRPGLIAVKEQNIKSPLRHAGLTKNEIRELSKELGLDTWEKPSFACLSSRFVYGETITEEKLGMVDKAEQFLLDLGFTQVRVRVHGDMARIEINKNEFPKILEKSDSVYDYLKSLGFTYVSLDLGGYRTGSMNETLEK